jgi:hypothetical protein
MRLPMRARSRISLLPTLAAGLVLLAACAGDATAPLPASLATEQGLSPVSPTGASKALVGATDGVYTFMYDPEDDQTLRIGPNRLVIPSKSVCRLDDSGYGPDTWNDRCRTEKHRFVITATVRGASTTHPRIDFEPALRFSPEKEVKLYMYVDTPTTSADWVILYCSTLGRRDCVDESQSDDGMVTEVHGNQVVRRIKHFSGYLVNNFAPDEALLLEPLF